jgi:D-alanyl-D-alanine carboxypeptidase
VVLRRSSLLCVLLSLAVVGSFTAAVASASQVSRSDRALDRSLKRLVARPDGPPGAIAVIQRGRHREVHSAGVANVKTAGRMTATRHMRIASTSKAFSGAAALRLVDEGLLSLNDTIGKLLPDLPRRWHPVTLRELLAHTSGVPDYTGSREFQQAVGESPTKAPPPRALLDYAEKRLRFPPGSRYEYSNSDNVVIGLMVQKVTGASYERVLAEKVFRPLGLARTLMPDGVVVPSPFTHGYTRDTSGALEDESQVIAFGGWAWASGGLVSTPGDLNRFIRGYVRGRLFGGAARGAQYRFVAGGQSDPPGPGNNGAGLALFRYRTRCGTVFGHTGSITGYTQLMAANRTGRRSIVFSINLQAQGSLIPALRRAEVHAVCAALARR